MEIKGTYSNIEYKGFEINLTERGSFSVLVEKEERESIGKMTFTFDNKEYLINGPFIKDDSSEMSSTIRFLKDIFLNQNYEITSFIKKGNLYVVKYKKLSNKIIDVIKKIKSLDYYRATSLRHFHLKDIKNNILYFSFFGHEVGGSYIYDYQVTPSYIEDIEFISNYSVKWTERTTIGFGADCYHFEMNLNENPISNDFYIPKGKLIYSKGLSNMSEKTFAYLYNLTKYINEGNLIDGVRIDNDSLYIDDISIAKIVQFDLTNIEYYIVFDLLIQEVEFKKLFFAKYLQNVNKVFKDTLFSPVKVYETYLPNRNTESLVLSLDNGDILTLSDDLLVDDELYQQALSNYSRKKLKMVDLHKRVSGRQPEFEKIDGKLYYQGFRRTDPSEVNAIFARYDEDNYFKEYVEFARLIMKESFDTIKEKILSFKTEQKETGFGYSAVDFLFYSKSDEMDNLLKEFVSIEMQDGFIPKVFYRCSKFDILKDLNLSYSK